MKVRLLGGAHPSGTVLAGLAGRYSVLGPHLGCPLAPLQLNAQTVGTSKLLQSGECQLPCFEDAKLSRYEVIGFPSTSTAINNHPAARHEAKLLSFIFYPHFLCTERTSCIVLLLQNLHPLRQRRQPQELQHLQLKWTRCRHRHIHGC